MPSLSVVIPFQGNDAQLEATVLSVLENRPSNCEVLVVHDGSYKDPYRLADEVIFVEAAESSDVIAMLNEGIMAACSPVVNTLLDGVVVSDGWSDQAVRLIEGHGDVAAVAVALKRSEIRYGLAPAALESPSKIRRIQTAQMQENSICAGPEIACGFYRRSTLLVLNGFRFSSIPAAELDMALALRELGCGALCDVHAQATALPVAASRETVEDLARLAVDYQLVSSGLQAAITEFLGAMSGGIAYAKSWSRAVYASQAGLHRARIQRAREEIEARQRQTQQELLKGGMYHRRAA